MRLVTNGCSYMNAYTSGGGHNNLGTRLNIPSQFDLSQSGCSNGRIIRTTLKDSFLTDKPTFYVLGMTFIVRSEITILELPKYEKELDSFEGKWTNPQNQMFSNRWAPFWNEKDNDTYVNLMFKESYHGLIDKVENLMYQLVSMIDSLESRGHSVLVFQQADQSYYDYLAADKFRLFRDYKNFVNQFKWTSIQWQHDLGVPEQPGNYTNKYGTTPENMRHRKEGEHHILNEFLINYIKEYKIIE